MGILKSSEILTAYSKMQDVCSTYDQKYSLVYKRTKSLFSELDHSLHELEELQNTWNTLTVNRQNIQIVYSLFNSSINQYNIKKGKRKKVSDLDKIKATLKEEVKFQVSGYELNCLYDRAGGLDKTQVQALQDMQVQFDDQPLAVMAQFIETINDDIRALDAFETALEVKASSLQEEADQSEESIVRPDWRSNMGITKLDELEILDK